jgi:hypothetical protein
MMKNLESYEQRNAKDVLVAILGVLGIRMQKSTTKHGKE